LGDFVRTLPMRLEAAGDGTAARSVADGGPAPARSVPDGGPAPAPEAVPRPDLKAVEGGRG
jgi:hypothetical protein